MSTHPAVDLQARIYQILSGDSTIASLVSTRIYDNAPDNAVYPFIQIGDDEFEDWSSHTFDGFSVTFTIHVWTQAQGMKTCKQIQTRIHELFHNVRLVINAQKTVSLRAGLATSMLDPDGRTHHGVSRFNLILGG